MINEAMFYDENKLNPFTTEVKRQCITNGQCLVKLRNDNIREVKYRLADEENDNSDIFVSGDWDFVWNMDGSSVTNQDFDMIEII